VVLFQKKFETKCWKKKNGGSNFCIDSVFSAVEQNVEGVVPLLAVKNKVCINTRRFLHPKGFNKTKSRESISYTPLIRACQLGHEKIVEELLDAGAHQNDKVYIEGSTYLGMGTWWTAREIAIKLGRTDIVSLFVREALSKKKLCKR